MEIYSSPLMNPVLSWKEAMKSALLILKLYYRIPIVKQCNRVGRDMSKSLHNKPEFAVVSSCPLCLENIVNNVSVGMPKPKSCFLYQKIHYTCKKGVISSVDVESTGKSPWPPPPLFIKHLNLSTVQSGPDSSVVELLYRLQNLLRCKASLWGLQNTFWNKFY